MWLAVDDGNRRIKWANFRGDRLLSTWSVPRREGWEAQLVATQQKHRLSRVGFSSVVPADHTRVRLHADVPILHVHHALTLPFGLGYRTPQTLGADRLAAAAAAWHYYSQGRPTIVIDAGTALTIDVIAEGVYLGGTIGVGPDLESQALSQGTASLPRVVSMSTTEPWGQSTQDALQSGILYGLLDRVHGSVERLTQEFGPERIVVATGGWLPFLAEQVPDIDHADSHLVLRGIQHLMQINPA